MKPGKVYLVGALVAGLISSAAADVIHFNSGGTTRDGQIVEMRPGEKIVFQDPVEGEQRYERSTIKEIQWSNLNSPLRAAQSNPAGAAYDPDLTSAYFDMALKTLATAKAEREKGDPVKAWRAYRELYNALVSETSKKILGPENSTKLLGSVLRELPPTSYQAGQQLMQSPETQALGEQALKDAVASSSEPNSLYLLALAEASDRLGHSEAAFRTYEQLARIPDLPQEQLTAARQAMERLNLQSGGLFAGNANAGVQQTPPSALPPGVVRPQPTPQVFPGHQPAAVAAAAAAQVPPPVVETPPAGPKWKQILWEIERSDAVNEIKAFPAEVIAGEHTGVLAGLGAVVFLGWVVPYSFLSFRAKRGDLFAAEYLPVSLKVGLFALIPWARKTAGQRPPKNRCPFCNKGIDNIEAYTDLNFYACPHCRENITPIYEMKDYVDHLITQLEMANRRKSGGDMSNVLEKDAMLKLVRGVLTLAVRQRASDLHAEIEMDGMKIRARIDGMMYEMMALPQSISHAFVSAIKVMANLDITEKRVPQDGKLSVWIDKADVDLRINTSPASLGEKVAIRILNQKTVMVDPTKLGLEGENLEKYERSIHRPHGLLIVTGPSGSGKSTTLYVALNELNTGDKNIVTIEDPVEYQIKGVSQMQVNPAANFTFATGLRSILRQDPDVIMVGEIRDKETAEIALDASTTGHLVFTTLHTIDAPTAFSRMADLGVEARRVSSAVNCVLGQRLIRTVCPECRKPYKPRKSDLEALQLANARQEITYVHGSGCDNCMNTGYFGRTGIFEFLIPDDAMREILEANASVSVIRELAKKNGYRTLREEGIIKITHGLTTPEEVVRMTT